MHSELGMSSRTARIFLSSTFRDFAEERDLLVRKVFPELRRRCRERQVELIDVDLRWGITEKQAQRGEVMPICMAEIDRSRPYFMGFIGERYGWVPEKHQYDPSLLREQPWLEEHRGGKSVTELEMLHGVLNNPAMAGRAFFYFRNPAYSLSKGGAYLSESSADKAKLEQLKDRIRHSGFPVLENYASPEALAQRVQEDLWRLIDESFPLEEVPDALSMERRKHEAYGGLRLRMYLGGAAYCKALDKATAKDRGFKPVLITGASGGGKSALLANWTQAYIRRHPDTLLFIHYLGSGADAADTVKLVTRLLQEIARATGDELKLESDPQKLLDMLPEWLARASSHAQREGGQWLLVFDGLDKVSSLRDLRWWPQFLPPKVKLIASCLDGEVLPAARKRMQWTELKVRPLGKRDQAKLIKDYLAKYRKEITPAQTKRVQSHPLSGNPLFLRTLLEELRVFGVYEKLEQKLTHYLQSQTLDDLFERVLERIEQDTSIKHVRSAMKAIWASRAGLAQDELLAITGLVPAIWAPIHNALDEALLESNGRLTFGHDYLRQAVEDRYLPERKRQRQAHLDLAQWFDRQEVSSRVAEELPWQWQQADKENKLQECLAQREMFEALNDNDKYELLEYWLKLKNVNIEEAYGMAWKKWAKKRDKETNDATAYGLAGFLLTAGCFALPERLYRYCIRGRATTLGPEHPQTLHSVNDLGAVLDAKGNYAEAVMLHRRALKGREKVFGPRHPDTLGSVHNLGIVLCTEGNYTEAEALYRRALKGYEKTLGPEHPDTLLIVNSLGNLLDNKGDYAGAEALHRRVLERREKSLGAEHPGTLASVNNLGVVLKHKGDYAGAEALWRRALAGREKSLGVEHPDTLASAGNLGATLDAQGAYTEAEALQRRALEGLEKSLGAEHMATLISVENLGVLLSHKGDYAGAEAILRRALAGREKSLGVAHPHTLASAGHLGATLDAQGDYAEAEALYRRTLTRQEKFIGADHPDTLVTVNSLGNLLDNKGDYAEAEMFHRSSLNGREKVFGAQHPDTLASVNNLATVLSHKGSYAEAEALWRRALASSEKAFGPEHPDTLGSVHNLGVTLSAKGDYAEAEALHRRALEIRKKNLGLEHSDTLVSVNNLACLLNETKRRRESIELLRFYTGLSEKVNDGVRYNLACYECLEGNLDEAKRLIAKHLKFHPEIQAQALEDADFANIREYIEAL